jgi:fused signal recognition particle receptor
MAEQEEKAGWFSRLTQALKKSSAPLTEGITSIFTKKKLDDETLERLEEILITADLGPTLASEFCDELRKSRFGKEVDEREIREALADTIAKRLAPYENKPETTGPKPFVVLMVGVNGAGKTTTLAKLAWQMKKEGRQVLMVAGDTFRAAAVQQLQAWGERTKAPVLAGEPNSDAASLAFKSIEQARNENIDTVLIDTAGRLHNKADLMAELQKIIRVLKKQDETAPHAAYLVLDGTTGQNAVAQVEVFQTMVPLTGLIITKLDGSAKGGALVGAVQKAKLPIVAIGVGEGAGDLRPFHARDYARALCGIETEAQN